MEKRVELLAPAGNYEAFLGAVNAGADAVYLGGEKFGARAYADNFTVEEICRAIRTAHFMGRRIYLTVNTLLKENEFEELVPYLGPFYETGLDGVIVQDIGVLCYIRRHFPGLSLHASTQMTLTGPEGCAFLKEQGVERIVPARELALEEVRAVKEQTGLEIECFIHGAMCYSYSGQCLFSSILGGRSGNRGRCAQPCRLPYRICGSTAEIPDVEYPLSLKDMCTISYIPALIEAGIDSFKIEGRMKKAEYAAGVTAVYRKYIDLYYREGRENYKVARDDLDMLQGLYIRSELQTGYYGRHNGREMITLRKPSYAGSDEKTLGKIRAAYLREPDKVSVAMKACLEAGKPATLQITGEKTDVTVEGAVVAKAQRAPLRPEDVRKKLLKTGNSHIAVSACEITMPDDVFLPVKALNELRREGVEAFEKKIILEQGMTFARESQSHIPTGSVNNNKPVNASFDKILYQNTVPATRSDIQNDGKKPDEVPGIDILVSSYGQLAEAVRHKCRRIYLESDLYLVKHQRVIECIAGNPGPEYYIALPYVLRAADKAYMGRLLQLLAEDSGDSHIPASCRLGTSGQGGRIAGFLVRNFEGAAFVCSLKGAYEMVPDAGLYCYNSESVRFWSHYAKEYTLPYELNQKEAGGLARYAKKSGMLTAMVVYGRIPMMVSANCIRKTAGQCSRGNKPGQPMFLKDRYGVTFPVEINCVHCYNIIYNSVPYSLHGQENMVKRIGADIKRYHFTVETAGECQRILQGQDFPFASYTTGHLKRGVE